MQLMRWWAPTDVWKYFRGHFFLLQLLLKEVAEESGDATARGATSSTQMWDADISESAASKKTGILKKAWRWITQKVARDMEIYRVTTKSMSLEYATNRKDLLTPEDWVAHRNILVDGGWTKVVCDTIHYSLRTRRDCGSVLEDSAQ